MATLNNKKIKDTFKGLLKTLDNAEITGQVEITDGDGNQTGVFINTDGSIKVTGTTEFGSLKDTGEDITITKFVDEADGISNNDNDSSIPTSAAVKDYVDSGVNTNAANISTNTSNISANTSDISTNTSAIALNTAKNSYPSADAAKVANISITQAVDLDTLESNVATNNSKVSFDSASSSKLSGIEAGAQVNDVTSVNGQTGSVTLTSSNVNEGTNLYYTDARVAANSAVAANTAKTGITDQQASAINANTSKVGITTQQADAIVANTAKISFDSDSSTKLSGIEANADVTDSTNVTSSLVSATSISETDKSAIRTNIGAGTGAGAVDSVNTQTGAVVLDTDDISEGTTNLYYTEARVSANTNVAANTAKVGITTEQANAITANTAKVGITTQQANDITTNNAKVGITTQQASDITTNNAKISFDSASSTKLAGIETGADVTDTANVTAAGALMDSEVDADIKTLSLPANTTISTFAQSFLDDADAAAVRTTIGAGTSDFDGAYSSLTGTPTIPTNNNELTNGAGYITDGNTGWDNTYGFITASSTDTLTNKSGNISQWTNDSGYTTNVGDITNVSVGTGLDGGGSSGSVTINLDLTEISVGVGLDTTATGISLDLSEFTDMTADMVETDEFIVLDNGAERRKAVNEIKSTLFSNNDLYKVIGIATDHASRVTLDSGTSEGATSIMQNFEILIAN